MAGTTNITPGSKLQMALDPKQGEQPNFNLICTYRKELDESAFLISVPMSDGKPLPMDESQKFLLKAVIGGSTIVLAAYPDDRVKEGIRTYWKMRRVSEQRQFIQRADERLKVALNVTYTQDHWASIDGKIESEEGRTLDISAGGAALFTNRRFEIGDMCMVTLPRVGFTPEGKSIADIVSVVCWQRDAPKGSPYHRLCGVQFRFGEDGTERERVKEYCAFIKKRYKL